MKILLQLYNMYFHLYMHKHTANCSQSTDAPSVWFFMTSKPSLHQKPLTAKAPADSSHFTAKITIRLMTVGIYDDDNAYPHTHLFPPPWIPQSKASTATRGRPRRRIHHGAVEWFYGLHDSLFPLMGYILESATSVFGITPLIFLIFKAHIIKLYLHFFFHQKVWCAR